MDSPTIKKNEPLVIEDNTAMGTLVSITFMNVEIQIIINNLIRSIFIVRYICFRY